MSKPIVLTFVAYYLPGYKSGGPVRTIANMVDRLGDELDFRIITSDRDSWDTKPYSHVIIDDWNVVGKAKVFYASSKSLSMRNLIRLIKETQHDVLYLNSFFSPTFSLLPLISKMFGLIPNRHTVIAPRGEFSSGALDLKSFKKHSYIELSKVLGIYRNLTWQASSESEANDIFRSMGTIAERIIIAKNLAPVSDDITENELHIKRKPDDPLRICFLSRIDKMKNLDYALQVLDKVTVPVDFNIYGVIDDMAYWHHCQEIIKRFPKFVTASYHGVIHHDNVANELKQYDLFFFPTRGENYGHVIYEALASGLPVLISDQTPWRNLEAHGVGWDISLDNTKRFREIIDEQATINSEDKIKQRYAAKRYARCIAMDDKVVADNIKLFVNEV